MTDYLDPEAPSPDPHAEDDRPRWTPAYMGEGIARRCSNCGQTLIRHEMTPDDTFCLETFLRQMDGDR